jgi:hypothetical protein
MVHNGQNLGTGHVVIRMVRGQFETASDVRGTPEVTELLQLLETCPLPPNKHGIEIAPSGQVAAVALNFTNNADLKEFTLHMKTNHPEASFFALDGMPAENRGTGHDGFVAYMATL